VAQLVRHRIIRNLAERTMLIITGILLIAIVGLLWTVVLSLIEADGRDDNGRTAPKKRNGAVGSHIKRAA